MAIYETTIPGTLAEVKEYVDRRIPALGFSISVEDETQGNVDDTKYCVMGLERFGYISQNRVSLNLTMIEYSQGVRIIALSLGGSSGAILKINTWSESNFVDDFVSVIDEYKKTKENKS